MTDHPLTIALPNKGRLYDHTIRFLDKCALTVHRDNERQYQATMGGLSDGVEVVFQRARDIPKVVGEGRIDLGITGYDIFREMGAEESTRCFSVFPSSEHEGKQHEAIPSLRYGSCSLVMAVPDHWVDISNMSDLAELAIVRKQEGQMLRIATEFPNLTKKHLFNKGVSYFEVTDVTGAAESAPRMGSADLISDLKSSGVTLAENRLKVIDGGTIINSGACLIASESLKKEPEDSPKMTLAKSVIDRIEAHLNAKKYWLITANLEIDGTGKSKGTEERLRQYLREDLNATELGLLGQKGPTIARVMQLGEEEDEGRAEIYSVSVQVDSENLESVITILRNKSGGDILVTPVSFVYDQEPRAYARLKRSLRRKGQRG